MRKTCSIHQFEQLIIEAQVTDAVHCDQFDFTMSKSLDQSPAEFFEGLFIVREVVVFEVDDAVTLPVAQFDLVDDIADRTAAIVCSEGGVHRAKRALMRTAPRGDHERHRLAAKSIRVR